MFVIPVKTAKLPRLLSVGLHPPSNRHPAGGLSDGLFAISPVPNLR